MTADHGMNAKHKSDKQPDVIYLQDLLDEMLGAGKAHVILPITDPYVVHHGSFGSFAAAYLVDSVDQTALLRQLQAKEWVDCALDRAEGCERFELPEDRVADIMVLSTRHKVLGSSRDRHDLSILKEPLRSHGGLTEQKVPLLLNRMIDLPDTAHLRNFDIYDLALNHVLGAT